MKTKNVRRRLLFTLSGGIIGASQLPSQWVTPIAKSLVLPAHAQTSPVSGGGTGGSSSGGGTTGSSSGGGSTGTAPPAIPLSTSGISLPCTAPDGFTENVVYINDDDPGNPVVADLEVFPPAAGVSAQNGALIVRQLVNNAVVVIELEFDDGGSGGLRFVGALAKPGFTCPGIPSTTGGNVPIVGDAWSHMFRASSGRLFNIGGAFIVTSTEVTLGPMSISPA